MDDLNNIKTIIDYCKYIFLDDKKIDIKSYNKLSDILYDILSVLFKGQNNEKAQKNIEALGQNFELLMQISEELDIESSTEKLQSYYLGYIASVMHVIKMKTEYESDRDIISTIENTKYLPDFLEILYKQDVMTFAEIYKYLSNKNKGLTKSALSNFFTRTEKYNLFDKKNHGKTVFYFITNTGRIVYKQLKSKRKASIESSSFTSYQLLELDIITNEIRSKTYNVQNIIDALSTQQIYYTLIDRPKVFEEKMCTLIEVAKMNGDPTQSLSMNETEKKQDVLA